MTKGTKGGRKKIEKREKENYLRPSDVDGSPNGVSVKFVRVFVKASNSSLQLSVLLATDVTNGLCNRLSKILFELTLVRDFGFGEEDLRKVGDGRGEEDC
jgi:hypothetical protein